MLHHRQASRRCLTTAMLDSLQDLRTAEDEELERRNRAEHIIVVITHSTGSPPAGMHANPPAQPRQYLRRGRQEKAAGKAAPPAAGPRRANIQTTPTPTQTPNNQPSPEPSPPHQHAAPQGRAGIFAASPPPKRRTKPPKQNASPPSILLFLPEGPPPSQLPISPQPTRQEDRRHGAAGVLHPGRDDCVEGIALRGRQAVHGREDSAVVDVALKV